jgi:hypothetical protein
MLYVEGLKANLLNIRHMCDDELMVQLSKKESNVLNSNGEWIMGGLRTIINCYGVESSVTLSCNIVKLDEVERWHQ